jgi:hypothetical protein
MMLRSSRERDSKDQAGDGPRLSVLVTRLTPEPAEVKLGRLWAGAARSIPIRTLPPEVKALRCMMVWLGTAGPEIWCPAAPPLPEEQAPPAVPTS